MSFFTTNGIYTNEDIKKQYKGMLRKFNPNIGDIGFSWIQHAKTFSLYNIQEIIPQVKEWRRIGVKSFEYNNKEFVVEGRKWYVLIVQPYKDGVMEECGMCPVSMLLFGTWVNGYTYAFEEESKRDLIFRLMNDEDETGLKSLDATCDFLRGQAQEEARKPICCLCKKECENEFGNNPYPLVPDGRSARCCGDCNRKEVITARIEGIFRCEEVIDDEERKEEILTKCKTIVCSQYQEIIAEGVRLLETKTPNDLLGDLLRSQFKDYPDIKSIAEKVETLKDRLDFHREGGIGKVMEYVSQRLGRHLNVRSLSSPKEVCSTTRIAVYQEFSAGAVGEEILKATKELQLDFQQATDTIRKNIENELFATRLVVEEKVEVKTKEELKKETTRKANKAKNQKEKERLEYEAKVAEASKFLAEQEKKKKQQAIAKKQKEQKKVVSNSVV
jgi:hypothetical protein